MIIEQTFTVNASRDRTAAFFLDIDRVTGCVSGVENVTEVEPGRYRAVLTVRLGPIRAAFQGEMSLDASQAPERLKATGEGRDRATGSVAKVDFTAELAEDEADRTTVNAVADVALRGRMAQFGTGVMRAAAGELVKEFAACANVALAETPVTAAVPSADSAAPAEVPPPPRSAKPVTPAPQPPSVLKILLRSLVSAAKEAVTKVADRIRARRKTGQGGQR